MAYEGTKFVVYQTVIVLGDEDNLYFMTDDKEEAVQAARDWLAEECGVRTLAMFHHDPSRTDDAIDAAATLAIAHGEQRGFAVVAAFEGLTLQLE